MSDKKSTELNDIERVTLACALTMFLESIKDFDGENKIIAPIVAMLSVGSIVKKLNISDEMDMFLD